jgi:hypothetical protein
MINLTKDQIKEIADQLDCGMKCYVDKETGAIQATPDFDLGIDDEMWTDVIDELEENWDNYVEIERMGSREAFDVMADFAESVDGKELRNALNKKHPFRNFNWVIHKSEKYREKWFDFKNQRLIEWVEKKIYEINYLEKYDTDDMDATDESLI